MKLYGVHEVAELMNWQSRVVSIYLKRGILPLPAYRVKATPIWTEEQMLEFQIKFANRIETRGRKAKHNTF